MYQKQRTSPITEVRGKEYLEKRNFMCIRDFGVQLWGGGGGGGRGGRGYTKMATEIAILKNS